MLFLEYSKRFGKKYKPERIVICIWIGCLGWGGSMANKEFTNLYVSVSREDDKFIDNLRLDKIKTEKKHYTKTDVVKHLIHLGMDVHNGKYLKLDPSIDEFVSQLQKMVIETGGEKVVIHKSKEQVYNMIIEKGLQHLDD
jgi:hypothetical protein